MSGMRRAARERRADGKMNFRDDTLRGICTLAVRKVIIMLQLLRNGKRARARRENIFAKDRQRKKLEREYAKIRLGMGEKCSVVATVDGVIIMSMATSERELCSRRADPARARSALVLRSAYSDLPKNCTTRAPLAPFTFRASFIVFRKFMQAE